MRDCRDIPLAGISASMVGGARRWGLQMGAVAALFSRLLGASPEENVALEYSAPAACPTEAQFRASVEELTRQVRFNAKAERRFVVRIEQPRNAPSHARFSGSVREGASQGAPKVEASDCRDVAAALALTVALAVDPEALSEPAPEAPAAGASSSATAAPRTEATAPAETSATPPTTAPTAQREPRSETLPEPAWGLELGLEGSLHFARGPSDATPLGMLTTETLHRVPFRMSVQLQAGWGRSANTEIALRWEPSVRLGLCPIWWDPARGLSVVICAGSEVARLVSDGGDALDVPLPSAVRTFWSIDGRARLRFDFPLFVVDVFGGAELPLTEIPYRVTTPNGERLIFSVDRRVGGVAGVGLLGKLF